MWLKRMEVKPLNNEDAAKHPAASRGDAMRDAMLAVKPMHATNVHTMSTSRNLRISDWINAVSENPEPV